MKPFMDEEFLLSTVTSRELYHGAAEKLPIVDYHCHIDPREIYENRSFKNITQVWLGGDHYKWRQMRWNGVEEAYITGNAADREKFQKWAETLPKLIGNPLYHWSHLELKRYFGYQGHLNGSTAQEVWELCLSALKQPAMSVRSLILRSNVAVICTTDDPADDLGWHKKLAQDDTFPVGVYPTWRPEKAMNIEKNGFSNYIARLAQVSGLPINSFAALKQALRLRMDYFAAGGCRICDHSLDYVMYVPAGEKELEFIFAKAMANGKLTREEELKYKTAFLLFAAGEYSRLGWAMQLHYGCKRDNNSVMFACAGPDTGFDCIGSQAPAAQLADFLNALHSEGKLPKTIIYPLNPNDNAAAATIIGCFQEELPGKLQLGSAWWFHDHKAGMADQMTALANLGCFGSFIGMLTDSRSFLSYTRHEYFRRILCELVGGWVENGEYPDDREALTAIIQGISYENAIRYFGFPSGKA